VSAIIKYTCDLCGFDIVKNEDSVGLIWPVNPLTKKSVNFVDMSATNMHAHVRCLEAIRETCVNRENFIKSQNCKV